MIEQFIKKEYKIKEFDEKADIYIINTCTVTNMADRKSRQMLRRAKELNPDSIIVACGCYAQVAKEELEKIPEIDVIYGTNEKNQIADLVDALGTFPNASTVPFASEAEKNNTQKEAKVTDVMYQKEFLDFGVTDYTEKTRAVVKVQDGCDRFCSYCIIPYARGHVRSRKIENTVEEVKAIAQNGIKEVVITGIHLASYGKDFKPKASLIDVLEQINKIDGIERIRLGSLEPTLITEEFLKRLTKLEKICDHFHLSLQSGCDETLKRMNRRYTTEEFAKSVELLRKYYKNVALTTDIIVGFPGETEEEFNETYEFLKKINFYQMHIFKYSPRKGTKAAVMEHQVPEPVKKERSNILLALEKKMSEEFREYYVGKQVTALMEEAYEFEGETYFTGYTKEYVKIAVKSAADLSNQFVKGTIRGRLTDDIYLMVEF